MKTEYQLWVKIKHSGEWKLVDFCKSVGEAKEDRLFKYQQNIANNTISDYRIVEVQSSTG